MEQPTSPLRDQDLERMLSNFHNTQAQLRELQHKHGVDPEAAGAYVERAKANPMVRNIVTLEHFISNQLRVE